jgi:antitoxin (DNA-binding transcriptional repressor) of toxin-antitoxin stability system
MIMETIKTVGVKALKDQLSSYLRDVKAGGVVLVTERGQVVAELHQPVRSVPLYLDESTGNRWVEEGKLRPPKAAKIKCGRSPVSCAKGTAVSILDQERGE